MFDHTNPYGAMQPVNKSKITQETEFLVIEITLHRISGFAVLKIGFVITLLSAKRNIYQVILHYFCKFRQYLQARYIYTKKF